jgi:hypothetical protein
MKLTYDYERSQYCVTDSTGAFVGYVDRATGDCIRAEVARLREALQGLIDAYPNPNSIAFVNRALAQRVALDNAQLTLAGAALSVQS